MPDFPRVSDHEVTPETWQEKVYGEVRQAWPALPPHSRAHNRIDYVLNGYVTPGYGVDTALLTRFDDDWDFAADTCIRKDGVDPESGCRYLEELAFEIAYKQGERELADKARVMTTRGVRRVFVMRVRGDREGAAVTVGPLMEWLAGEQRWRVFDDGALIEDPCLHHPVPVRALLDATTADDAVAEGLLKKGNESIQRLVRASRDDGYCAGLRAALRNVLDQREVAVDDISWARIESCRDAETLLRWAARALQVSRAAQLFE